MMSTHGAGIGSGHCCFGILSRKESGYNVMNILVLGPQQMHRASVLFH